MLTYEIRDDDKIVIVEPQGPLTRDDFDRLAEEVDHFLLQHDSLKGILVHVKEFPGWEDLAGLMGHIKFVREHDQRVERIALVSDSTVAALGPKLAELFIRSEIETFEYEAKDLALDWLRSN